MSVLNFSDFNIMFKKHFVEMITDATAIFEVPVERDELWNIYLETVPAKYNKIFRKKRELDCSCCRHFMRSAGQIVVIKNNKMITLWDFEIDDLKFGPAVKALSKHMHTKTISDVFVCKQVIIGTPQSLEIIEDKNIKWEHFSLNIPKKFVDTSSLSIGEIKGKVRDIVHVFSRSLVDFSIDSVEAVLELISTDTLYRGNTWEKPLKQFLKLKKEYEALSKAEKILFVWNHGTQVGPSIGKIRNHSIGTLLTNLNEGMEITKAVTKYEKIVAPENYKRPKPIFTKAMLEKAKATLKDLGYLDSLERRFATIDDITVNNILFANRDAIARMNNKDVFEELETEIPTTLNFDRIEEISIKDFIEKVLPTTKELELFLENNLKSNLVSLIAPKYPDANIMLKWSNNFSWAYTGNIADSSLTQQVRDAGGRTDGVLRFSHSWNHFGRENNSLMDLHVFLPGHQEATKKGLDTKFSLINDNYGNSERVGWNHRRHTHTDGSQDVDYTDAAPAGYIPVENITFPNINKLPDGIYTFKIHNWNTRSVNKGGFKAEIAFNGEIYSFDHPNPLKHKEWITLAKLKLKDEKFEIIEMAENNTTPVSMWELTTKQFVPVSTLMLSPNFWDDQTGIGNKHYFFMLKGCVNNETPSGFFNEYLKEELRDHRRVIEAITNKKRIEDVKDQLSGVGFSSTKRNSIILKVKGNTERILKVKI